MIERIVFVATMFTMLMIGINAFLMVGNTLPMPDGSSMNIFGDLTTGTLTPTNVYASSQDIEYSATAAAGLSTTAPGTAQGIPIMQYTTTDANVTTSTQSGLLGLDWIKNALFGANLVGLRLAAIYPFAAPIILIMVAIASLLQAFTFMYWGMAGARALFARFL